MFGARMIPRVIFIVSAVLALGGTALVLNQIKFLKDELAHMTVRFKSERQARLEDQRNWAIASASAQQMEAARVQRVRKEQEQINAASSAAYRTRIDRLRGLLLHSEGPTITVVARRPDGEPVPSLPAAAGGAAASADHHLAELIQLDELINWVEATARIDVALAKPESLLP